MTAIEPTRCSAAVPAPDDVLVEEELRALLSERAAQRAGSGSGLRVRDEPGVLAGLAEWLLEALGSDVAISGLTRMSGAGTNVLYRFTLAQGGTTRPMVLRVKVPGSGVVTHLGREFQLMRAAGEILPVPAPVVMTLDHAYVGAPAVVTEFSSGVQMPSGQGIKASGMGITYPEPLRGLLAPHFVDHEAALHSFDWTDCDLSEFDLPRPGTTDALDWRLAFWDRVWDEDRLEEHPTMVMTREWLWANRPVVDVVSLLHGDYRNGNFLFDEASGDITAVLDWEMGWMGDRHADLAYTMFRSFGQVDAGRFLVGGLMEESAFRDRYERASGLSIDPVRLHYYFVFNMYWSNISLMATGLRNAHAGLTQVDVMYQTMMGMGVMSCAALNSVLGKATA